MFDLKVSFSRRVSRAAWFLFILFPQSFALASDYHSPRTAALGGAGHAGPMLNDAIYLNPSFESFLPSYSVSGNYTYYKGSSDGSASTDPHGHVLNGSLQDGRSTLFQAGVGYTKYEDRKVISVGASRSIVKRLGVGLGGKFTLPNTNFAPIIPDSMFSVAGIPMPWLQLAFVIDNLFESAKSRSYGLYREYILGTKVNIQGITLVYFDPHLAPHAPSGSYGQEAGLEFPIMQDFFLRFGSFRNSALPWDGYLRANGYSAGFGWIGPRMSMDYGLTRVLSPLTATAHHFGWTVYF